MLAAIGGHLIDLYRLANFDVANPHSYSKLRQIRTLARRTGSTLLVEAGTYLGNTAMRCSRHFERVITIELDPQLHQLARRYLSSRRNVVCMEGDALKLLPSIFEDPEVRRALVFLDGHYSGGETACGELAEPACNEVVILGRHKDKINAVIIDDFRCFGRDPGWPKRSVLLRSLEDTFGDEFDYTIHLDQVLLWRCQTVGAKERAERDVPANSHEASLAPAP
jgi:hypothetical protein